VQHNNAENLSLLTDEALAALLQKGHEPAFDEIVRRFQGSMYAAAYRVTGNREDALDVTQESLIKVHNKIDLWAPTGGFMAWVQRITTNHAFDVLRKKKRRRAEFLAGDFLEETTHIESMPEKMDTIQQVRAQEIEDRIREALLQITPMQRQVFMLRHFEGLPLADIAKELNCSLGSVKVHLFRAVRKLRDLLEQYKSDL
jgi:RNA polymerase sigma-70 factor (ECF subfamily)